jgi:hypothetical protein
MLPTDLGAGTRVRVWWTEEQQWFAGRVTSVQRNGHTIRYDDGHTLKHNLDEEQWEKEPAKRKATAPPEKPAKRSKPSSVEASPPKHDNNQWSVGMRCRAQFGATARGPANCRWFPGKIALVHADGSLDIAYDDGDREQKVKPAYVKPPAAAKTASPPAATTAPPAAATPPVPPSSDLCKYELQRNENIARNQRHLQSLGIVETAAAMRTKPAAQPKKYREGAVVEVKCGGSWLVARVDNVNDDGTYDLVLRDEQGRDKEEEEDSVPPQRMRAKKSGPPPPSRKSGRLSGEMVAVAARSSGGKLSAEDFVVGDDDLVALAIEPKKRASSTPTLTPAQRAKLDSLEPVSAAPLRAGAEAEAYLQKLQLAEEDMDEGKTFGGWRGHKARGTCQNAEKRSLLKEAAREHGLRWPEWLGKIHATVKMGTTDSARDQTMYGLEAAACGALPWRSNHSHLHLCPLGLRSCRAVRRPRHAIP